MMSPLILRHYCLYSTVHLPWNVAHYLQKKNKYLPTTTRKIMVPQCLVMLPFCVRSFNNKSYESIWINYDSICYAKRFFHPSLFLLVMKVLYEAHTQKTVYIWNIICFCFILHAHTHTHIGWKDHRIHLYFFLKNLYVFSMCMLCRW